MASTEEIFIEDRKTKGAAETAALVSGTWRHKFGKPSGTESIKMTVGAARINERAIEVTDFFAKMGIKPHIERTSYVGKCMPSKLLITLSVDDLATTRSQPR